MRRSRNFVEVWRTPAPSTAGLLAWKPITCDSRRLSEECRAAVMSRLPLPCGSIQQLRRLSPTSDAAKHAFRVTDGAFVPKFYLEGRATRFDNSYPYINGVTHEDYAGKVVMSWDIFRGGQDVWRRSEMAERHTEATMRHARLQRDANESIDKAWNARTITVTRIAALTRQLEADRKTIAAFQKEYELGQRSLIDLLNAQNQFFNASVSLTSARALIIFADYQLLAAMGTLIEYLKAPPPVDVAPVDLLTFGLPAYGFPTLRVNLPQTGSEPLRVMVPEPVVATSARPVTALHRSPPKRQTVLRIVGPGRLQTCRELQNGWHSKRVATPTRRR